MARIKTEEAWLKSTTPHSLLLTLKGKRMPRQRRLFAVACCRRWLHEMADPESRLAVEVAERHADGLADRGELEAAYHSAQGVAARRLTLCQADTAEDLGRAWAVWRLAHAAQLACAPSGAEDVAGELLKHAGRLGPEHQERERIAQSARIRDVFGNPFRPPPVVDPAWLSWNGGTVPKLARAIDDERDLPAGTLDANRLLVLADALEEAGCGDGQILGHLRSAGEHVRGCFAVAAVLGTAT
jgi:hypothetical protein